MILTLYSDVEISLEDQKAIAEICRKYQIKDIALSKDSLEVFNLAIKEQTAPRIGPWGKVIDLA